MEGRRNTSGDWRPASLDALEPRLVLATIVWDGGPGGLGTDWHNPVNWVGDAPPGAADDAVLGAGPTVSITGLADVLRVTSDRGLSIGGTLAVADASQLNAGGTLSGTLAGPGDVSIGGTLNWTGGVMTGPGRTVISVGATLNISGASHDLSRVMDIAGTAVWTGGVLRLNAGTINNTGSFTASAPGLLQAFGSGGVNAFNNLGGGTFTKAGAGEARFFVSASGVAFNNSGNIVAQAGTLTLSGGGTTTVAVQVPAGGTLTFGDTYAYAAGGSLSGAGTINFTGGIHTLPAGQFNPTGVVNFTAGTVTINNPFTPAALGPIGATAVFNAAVGYSGALVLTGSAGFAAAQSFTTLDLAGTLAGGGAVTVTQALNWTFGAMSGGGATTVGPGGVLSLSGSGTKTLSRVLNGNGDGSWTDGALAFAGGALNNYGVFTINTDGFLQAYGNSGVNTFNNAGTLRKLGAGDAQFTVNVTGVALANTGTVEIDAGTLTLGGGGSNAGAIDVAAVAACSFAGSYTHTISGSLAGAGTITFAGGTHALPAGQFVPSGALSFTGGSVTVGGTIAPALLGPIGGAVTFNAGITYAGGLVVTGSASFSTAQTLSSLILSGVLGGTGDVTVAGTLTWTGGSMIGTGKTFIAASGALSISGGATHTLSRTLQNNGGTTWSSGPLSMSGGTFVNAGTFTASAATTLQASGSGGVNTFANAGTFVQAGAGQTRFATVGSAVSFVNTGSVQAQAGTLWLGGGGSTTVPIAVPVGGTLVFAADFTILPGGSVSGAGTIAFEGGTLGFPAGSFTPTGTVNFSGGTITLANAITPSSLGPIGATVNFNAPQSFALVTLTGTLGGTADVTITGTLVWTAGLMVGSGKTIIAGGAALDLSGTTTRTLSRTIQMAGGGTAVWSSGDLSFLNGTLTTLVGASFRIQSNAPLLASSGGGTNAWINNGSLIKGGSGEARIGVPFTNTGTIDIQGGILTLAGGGANTGPITAQPGATLALAAGYTHGAAGTISGGGTVSFSGGTHSLPAGAFTPTGTVNFTLGTVTVNNTFAPAALGPIAGTVTLNAAVGFGGGIEIPGSATFAQAQTFSGLVLTGTLGGPGQVTITGALDWSGGSMTGPGTTVIGASGVLSISGGAHTLGGGRTLELLGPGDWLAGDMTFTGGTLRIGPAASLVVNPSGTLTLSGASGVNAVDNQGSLTKTGAGSLVFATGSAAAALTNTGGISVGAGTLALATGTNGGTITVAGGTGAALTLAASMAHAPGGTIAGAGAVTITGGTHAFPAGAFTATGTLNLTGGTIAFNSTVSPSSMGTIGATVTFNALLGFAGPLTIVGSAAFQAAQTFTTLTLSGTITGPGDVHVTTSMTWSGGTMGGTGVTTVAPGATLTLSSAAKTLARLLVNQGAATWNGGNLTLAGAVLRNAPGGTFTVSTNVTLQVSGGSGVNAFENHGAFTKLAAGDVQFKVGATGVPFVNTGPVNVNAGTLTLAAGGSTSGPIVVAAAGTLVLSADYAILAGGSISGAGTITIAGGTHTFAAGQFTPTGTVHFNAGTVTIGSSFAPATLGPIAGSVTFNAPMTYAGTLDVTGTAVFNVTQALAGLSLSGTLAGTGDVTITGTFTWSGGSMTGTGRTSVAAAGTLNLTTTLHTLGGGRTLSVAGVGSWTAGNLALAGGTLVNEATGTLTVSTTGTMSLTGSGLGNAFRNDGTLIKQGTGTFQISGGAGGAAFTNPGTLNIQIGFVTVLSSVAQLVGDTLTGGTWFIGNATTLTFPAGAVVRTSAAVIRLSGPTALFPAIGGLTTNAGSLTLSNGRAFDFTPTGNMFTNSGSFIKGGSGLTTIPASITLNNPGTVGVINGTLTISGPISQLAAGVLGGGTWSVTAPGVLSIPGTIHTSHAAIILSDPGSSFAAVNGLTTNTGSLAILNGRSFTAASLANSGSITIGPGGSLSVTGPIANNGTAAIDGTLNVNGGGTSAGEFTLAATGQINFNAGATLTGAASITGAGAINFTAGATAVNGSIDTTGAATIAGGTATLAGPTRVGALAITAGSLVLGADAQADSATVGGTLDLGVRRLSLAGAFTQTAGGLLRISAASAKSYGRIDAAGGLSLDGAMQVSWLAGYSPGDSTVFDFLAGGARVGAFASVAVQPLAGGAVPYFEYHPSGLRLIVLGARGP